MKKLLAMMCLALGVTACGGPVIEEAEASFETDEQALCPTGCPAGTTSMGYHWVCTGRTTSACRSGFEEETLYCYDSSTGMVVSGGTTCRTRCGCLVPEPI
ncbi:hypothetical protein A176_004836 [Myxococcus hansupus]|uniref:Lipoprotein n=1 Tax=Pseudomyxococcus hansupus TaxID=1297742 RepID=A0A0H4WYN8_9BACT|nr:hypothetical protein [Myxococcus hansupus]AKQ67924.1 hypothetical protein A176_004836 [Myxococcus hansupus]